MVDNDDSIKMVDKKEKRSSGDYIKSFKAKTDHTINQNGLVMRFEKGEIYDDIPKKWEETLKSEKVL